MYIITGLKQIKNKEELILCTKKKEKNAKLHNSVNQ